MKPVLVLAALFAMLPAYAQKLACNPGGSQSEMNQCAFDELRKADAELNAAYQQALASMKDDAVARERLQTAQRLWIQLRDADLEAQFPLAEGQSAQLEYGSIYPLEYATAKAELTRQRTAYLRGQFPGQPQAGQ